MELYFIPFTPFGPPSRPRPVLQSCAVKRGERRKLFSAFPALPPPIYPCSDEGKVEGPGKRRSCFRSRQKRGPLLPSPCFDPTFNYFPPSPPHLPFALTAISAPICNFHAHKGLLLCPVLGEREEGNFAQGRKRGNLLWMGGGRKRRKRKPISGSCSHHQGWRKERALATGAGVHGSPGESRPPLLL